MGFLFVNINVFETGPNFTLWKNMESELSLENKNYTTVVPVDFRFVYTVVMRIVCKFVEHIRLLHTYLESMLGCKCGLQLFSRQWYIGRILNLISKEM